jgi:hypothetical protein
MNKNSLIHMFCLIFVGLLLVACGAQPPTEEPDRIATRVAEEKAVAATLTADALLSQPPPTSTPVPPTATAIPPTDTPIPPTATSEEPAADTPVPTDTPAPAPTDTPPPPPAPTPTPILIAVLPVDGSDGNRILRSSHVEIKEGRAIVLPGYSQADVTEPMVFRDKVVFQVEVFDPNVGSQDGDGIQDVKITIRDGDQIVHERTEQQAGYCVFGGGEPDCNVWVFADHDYKWPGGDLIINYRTYNVDIVITPEEGEAEIWRWSFMVELPGQVSPPQARINNITVQYNLYVVDFETFGFEPRFGDMHVHFFFNTVNPEDAGIPGSGPWQLYPASQDQPGTSPFTMLGVNDRPDGATQMCILVANYDHSVQPNTGNCFDLP